MDLTLHVWRQKNKEDKGRFEQYEAKGISPDMSFLEMVDEVNEDLIRKGKDPIVFDHDCREGICGMCSQMINGVAHGPDDCVTVCQLHMRKFSNGDTIYIEPWRSRAFPVLKDLMVDRGALERIIQSYGYTSAHTGGIPDGNAVMISKEKADLSMDAAAYRLRRLRRLLPERFGDALHRGEDRPLGSSPSRGSRSCPARPRHGRADGCGRFRQLHQPLRVRSPVPERDQGDLHQPHEPRTDQVSH